MEADQLPARLGQPRQGSIGQFHPLASQGPSERFFSSIDYFLKKLVVHDRFASSKPIDTSPRGDSFDESPEIVARELRTGCRFPELDHDLLLEIEPIFVWNAEKAKPQDAAHSLPNLLGNGGIPVFELAEQGAHCAGRIAIPAHRTLTVFRRGLFLWPAMGSQPQGNGCERRRRRHIKVMLACETWSSR